MPQKVEVPVETTIPTREVQEFLKEWNKLLKTTEQLTPTHEALNKAMKENAGIIATMTANSKSLNEEEQENLKRTRLNLAAQKEISSQRKEAARNAAALAKALEAVNKQIEEDAKRLAKIEQDKAREAEKAAREIEAAAKKREAAERRVAREAEKAHKAQTRSIGRVVKAIGRWVFASATLFFLYRRLRRAVQETVRELTENTREYNALTESATNFRRTLVLAIVSQSDLLDLLDKTAKALDQISVGMTRVKATTAGLRAVVAETAPELEQSFLMAIPPIRSGILLASRFIVLIGKLTNTTRILNAEEAGRAKSIEETNKALEDAAATTKDYSNAIKSLVNQSLQFDKAMEKNAQSLRDIQAEYAKTIISIQNEATQALQDIETDLADNIADINATALEDRQDAFDDFNKAVIKAQQRANKTVANNAKRHQLAMEFAQRRHNLTMLQNQRIFEFERELLVAEGDVLAIEELDARHKLEQQAAEENFQLQMQQAEALAQLQAQIISDAIRDQIGELRAGLAERLAEIEEGRRQEIEEAEKRAEELRQQEIEDATRRFIEAELQKQARIDQVEDEERKLLESNAEFLAKLAQDTETDFRDVVSAWEAIYGPTAELATLVEETYRLIEGRTFIFAQNLTNAINAIQLNLPTTLQGMGGGRPSFLPSGFLPSGRGIPGFQFGGDFIASQPQLIEVGHGPERVTVQPLSAIGMMGNVTHRWGGGAIPVQGQGSVSGADLNALGNQIARKTVSSMRTQMRDVGRKRGT